MDEVKWDEGTTIEEDLKRWKSEAKHTPPRPVMVLTPRVYDALMGSRGSRDCNPADVGAERALSRMDPIEGARPDFMPVKAFRLTIDQLDNGGGE